MHKKFLTEPRKRLPCPTFELLSMTYCFSCPYIDHTFIFWLLTKTRPADELKDAEWNPTQPKEMRYSGDLQFSLQRKTGKSIGGLCHLLKPVSSWSFLICSSTIPPVVSLSALNFIISVFVSTSFSFLIFFAWVLPFIWNWCGYMGENKFRIWSYKLLPLTLPSNKRVKMVCFSGRPGEV